jgi:hypothetical protein
MTRGQSDWLIVLSDGEHYKGKRPADSAPIEGNMSAIQRAATGLYATRGVTQSCQRDSSG